MRWWKCEQCRDDDWSAPCFLSTSEAGDRPPVCCPWYDEETDGECLYTEWAECGPAPHEPTHKEFLQVEDDTIPVTECFNCVNRLWEDGMASCFIDSALWHPGANGVFKPCWMADEGESLPIEDDPLPARECKACGGSGKVLKQIQHVVDQNETPIRLYWEQYATKCPVCEGLGYIQK